MIRLETHGASGGNRAGAIYEEGDPTPWANWNARLVDGSVTVWAWEVFRHQEKISYGSCRGVITLESAILSGCRIYRDMG